MKLLFAIAVLATVAPAGAWQLPLPDHLHPSIEDRRTRDTTLWAPLPPPVVPTSALVTKEICQPLPYIQQRLPRVPVDRRLRMTISREYSMQGYYDRFIPSALEDDPMRLQWQH